MSNLTRRRFLRTSATGLGAAGAAVSVARAAGPLSALTAASTGVLGANEKIRIGLIGSGGMGRGDLATFLQFGDVDCPVICDVDDKMLAEGVKVVEQHRKTLPETVKDFRKVIDRKDLDAVLVATPDHWHALPTIMACQAGKDVYVEKPLATSIIEGQAMVKAAKRHQRVVQMGTQWRSGPHYAEAVEHVHSGKLGRIRQVRCWAYLTWAGTAGKFEDGPAPEGVDYDMWLGPAPQRAFNKSRFHFSFRWFWDYAGGLMTDWGVHLLNIAMWGMKNTSPKRIVSVGGKFKNIEDASETPDTQCTTYDFGDFILIFEHNAPGGHGCDGREHGIAFYGTEQVVIVDTKGWEIGSPHIHDWKPEVHKAGGDGRPAHVRNFLDCMKSRQQPVENVELGHKVSNVALLGNVAFRSRQSIEWDADKEQVIGNDRANELLSKPYRAPWELPKVD